MTKEKNAELQKQNYLEGRRRYEEKCGKTIAQLDAELEARLASQGPSTPDVGARLQKIVDDYRRRNPEGVPKVEKHEEGPTLRQARELAEALGRIRRGHIGEAIANHKLEPYLTHG
jgi:hypothetical protein